ncbi:7-carboxy-7-deazaguanine synthase QueE [Candidatus Omnitrophota bacterium]
MKKARITEIFTSIQGEGLYVGEGHIFVRFYGCNLSCKFCDESRKTFFSEYAPDEIIEKLAKEKGEIISLTGGEPLRQTDFLKELLPALKEKDLKIYLETNGILKDRLLEVLDHIDIISMDLKLPSSTGLKAYWQEHSMFLREAVKKEVFVKSIVTKETHLSDIEAAISLVKDIDKNIPFIIQPASLRGIIERIDGLPIFFDKAKEGLSNVRIIPQVHKILEVR